MKKIAGFCFFLLTISILSCNSDNSTGVNANDLDGSWVCENGTDNGETATLMIKSDKEGNPGAEITFKSNTLTFPILETAEKSKTQTFQLKDNKIYCQKDKDLIFEIKNKSDKKMTLSFNLQGHSFILNMVKTK